jgi:hypothetical protein
LIDCCKLGPETKGFFAIHLFLSASGCGAIPAPDILSIALANSWENKAMTMTDTPPTKLKGVNVQFNEADLARLDDWRRRQSRILPLATSIRALVNLALKAAKDGKRKDTAAQNHKGPALKAGPIGFDGYRKRRLWKCPSLFSNPQGPIFQA